jgi:hypothetical protein
VLVHWTRKIALEVGEAYVNCSKRICCDSAGNPSAVATDAKKLDTLWKRAREYLIKCGGEEPIVAKICDSRDSKLLAQAVSAVAAGKPVPKFL